MLRKIHLSWLIALFCLAFVVGVWAALYVKIVPDWLWPVATVVTATSFWLKRGVLLPFVAAAAWCIGLQHGSINLGDLSVYEELVGEPVELSARVKEDPSRNARGQLAMQLDSIKLGDHTLPGSIWAAITTKSDIKRGDIVDVRGVVGEGFGNFPASLPDSHLLALTRPSPGDVGRVIRDWFADAVRLVIPEPQASLGIGFLTGQKSALPDDLAEALKVAGLTHIVVASGYNLTILVRLSRRVLMRISKFIAAVGSAAMITAFIMITGLSPSMSRAGLVAGLSLLAWYYGRRLHPFVLLPLAVGITVAWQPSFVWGDLGWQLSFSAFAGVMVVAPLLQRFFFGEKAPGTMRQILGETVAAHIITAPIVAVSFGVLSNVATPANVLVVPLVPLAMLLTFISGVLALAAPLIAGLVALTATWLLTYMTEVARLLSELPFAQLELAVPTWAGIAYYIALGLGCFWMWRVTRYDLRSTNLIE